MKSFISAPFNSKTIFQLRKFLFPFIYDRLYLSEEIEKNIKNIAILADVEPSTLVHEFKLALDIFINGTYTEETFQQKIEFKEVVYSRVVLTCYYGLSCSS